MKLKAFVAALAVAAILPMAALADELLALRQGQRSALLSGPEDVTRRDVCAHVRHQRRQVERLRQVRFEVGADRAAEPAGGDGGLRGRAGRCELRRGPRRKTFAQFYGSGKKGANAMGQCVQSKRVADSAADKQKVVNAARVQGRAEGDGRRSLQGQARQHRERIRQVRFEARCREAVASAARPGGALRRPARFTRRG